MNQDTKDALYGLGIILICLVGAGLIIWGIVWGVSKIDLPDMSSSSSYSAPAPQAKPTTKTRCDFTGFMSSSIIAEEAANGYQFAGRVNTFLCGESGLSFYLREGQ